MIRGRSTWTFGFRRSRKQKERRINVKWRDVSLVCPNEQKADHRYTSIPSNSVGQAEKAPQGLSSELPIQIIIQMYRERKGAAFPPRHDSEKTCE